MTLGDKWDIAHGRPPGFDILRVTLALSVILWHSVAVCYGMEAESWFYNGPLKPLIWFIVPSFFALSGFLVAGSLERNNLPAFLTLRVIRIFPALTVEVVISALLIGPLFTLLPPRAYFSDPLLHQYFLNVFGYIHYYLPGLFTTLPTPGLVNGQLWTVPHELECYLALALFALVGATRRPRLFLALLGAAFLLLLLRDFLSEKPASTAQPPGRMLVICFLFGVALYMGRSWIRLSMSGAIVSAVAYALLLYASTRVGEDLASMFVAYITVYLGLALIVPNLPVLALADYSYGIYLYGYPVQQVVAELLPQQRIWYVNFLLSVALTIPIAAASWHFVERPVMQRKKPILRTVAACESWIRHWFGEFTRRRMTAGP